MWEHLCYWLFLKLIWALTGGRMHATVDHCLAAVFAHWSIVSSSELGACTFGHWHLLFTSNTGSSSRPGAFTGHLKSRIHSYAYPLASSVCTVLCSYHHHWHYLLQCSSCFECSLAHFSMQLGTGQCASANIDSSAQLPPASEATSFVAKLQKVDIKICAHKLPTALWCHFTSTTKTAAQSSTIAESTVQKQTAVFFL